MKLKSTLAAVSLAIAVTEVFASDVGAKLSMNAPSEPDSYSMLLAGIGLMAAIASRRRS